MPSVNFTELANSHAVQIVVGTIILVISAWTAKRSISNRESIIRLEDSVGRLTDDFKDLKQRVENHYQHRFNQIAEILGIEYKDEE